MRPLLSFAALLLACVVGFPAQAEIKKFLNVCGEGKLCPSFQLAATPPDGWTEDKQASKEAGVQIFLPRGKTFGNAEALIYVKVSVRGPSQSVADFARVSQERWRKSVPDTRITKQAAIERRNGKPAFEHFSYENPSQAQQAFERVAFGEDTDAEGNPYFVMVVMTGRNKKQIEAAEKPYRAFVGAH